MKIIELKMKRPRFFVSPGDDDEEKNACPLEKLFEDDIEPGKKK